MSGGGGGPIIIHSTAVTLKEPQVHGNLPQSMQDLIDPILAKDEGSWTDLDKIIVGHVYDWALCHLQ